MACSVCSPAVSVAVRFYTKSGKGPESSINYVSCHGRFTLNDVVSFCDKHNEANGENNHDGTDANFSETSALKATPRMPASRNSGKASSRTSF